VDEGEVRLMKELGIAHLYAQDVDKIGVEAALAQAMAHLTRHSDVLFLSLDLDAFDPAEAPATGTPVPGGLHRDSFLPALLAVLETHKFAGFEIVEFNPTLPGAEETYELLVQVLTFMLAA
jgi:arginase